MRAAAGIASRRYNAAMTTTIDSRQYRSVLGRFAAGVTVVTVQTPQERRGMTASAFCRLSEDPPLVLVCVNHDANLHRVLSSQDARGFAVNILTADQQALSNFFAGYGELPTDPFEDAGVTTAEASGAPLLPGCLAWLDCRLHAAHAAGDHTIYVGEVAAGEVTAPDAEPLIYHHGAYRQLTPKT